LGILGDENCNKGDKHRKENMVQTSFCTKIGSEPKFGPLSLFSCKKGDEVQQSSNFHVFA
jgi:hypothetical protein